MQSNQKQLEEILERYRQYMLYHEELGGTDPGEDFQTTVKAIQAHHEAELERYTEDIKDELSYLKAHPKKGKNYHFGFDDGVGMARARVNRAYAEHLASHRGRTK